MSLNAATIEYLLSKGLTGEDLLEIARRSEARRDPTAAERQAKYRARRDVAANEWEAIRHRVFERDGHACTNCGSTDRIACDHVVPLVEGGKTVLSNLTTLCKSCNSAKGGRSLEAWRASLSRDSHGDFEAKERSPTPPKEKHPPLTPKGVAPRRLPDDFDMPAEWKDWARDKRGWSAADIDTEAENFTDYWQARGSGAAKRDWRKTWQTWVRNSKRPDGSFRNAPSAGPFDRAEYEARLAKIGRHEPTGPPGQSLGNVVGKLVNQSRTGAG